MLEKPLIGWRLGSACGRAYPVAMLRRIPPAARFAAAFAGIAGSAALADARPAALAANLVLGSALLVLAWIDARTLRLPDSITFPLIAAGLGVAMAGLGPPPEESLAGAVAGFAAFALLGLGYRALRGRDGLGLGDAKLLAAGGAWAGVAALPDIVLAAAVIGLVQAALSARRGLSPRGETMIPFGPAIAAAIWLARLTGGGIWTGE